MSKLKYFDGTNWNEVNGNIVGDTLPIGAIIPYCSTTAPANWLVCDGSYVSKETYADLYNIIGDDYLDGGTAPTGTFRLPNLKGKVPVGYNSGETEFDTMGETGGEKTHTLTVQEMPSHNHKVYRSGGQTAGYGALFQNNSTLTELTAGPVDNTGGGQAHNNLQPYQVVCYIIKVSQSAGLVANVSNTYSTSQSDTYSCDYINGIIESGSNTNGYYIKYVDGTMICYGSKSGTTTWSDWWSFAKRTPDGTSALSCTYPQNFIDSNINVSITTGYGSTTFSASYNSISTTSFSFVCYKPTNDSSTNYAIKYIAVGRWK